MNIIKRDGRRRKFNPTKIVIAIQNALIASNTTFTDEDLDKISDTVIETVQQLNKTSVKVEEINSIVEKELMEHYPAAAKNFILFREERNRVRNTKSEIVKTIKEITESDLKSSNILRDNANESGATPAGTYGKIASETNKMYNLLNNINRKYAQEHKDGYIHIHDLNQYNLTFNCLFAPVGKLLKSGFDSGTGFLRSPKSIQSAAALTAVILQLQSNQQYGGIADDNIDFDLAPFVDISFKKNLKEELESYLEYNPDHIDIDLVDLNTISMNQPVEMLYAKFPKTCVDRALAKTDADTHQAMEGLIGNLNSLQSRSGNQVPFSSLNFGLDISNCGRMVTKNLIKSQMEGLGDGLTAIFPILIFKLMRGYTKDAGDPNYDLYLDSIKCLARRFYPNFVSVDSSFNKPYVKYNEKEFDVENEVQFKVRGEDRNIHLKVEDTIFEYPVYQIENPEIPGDYWDVYEIKGNKVIGKQIIPGTTISAMGCRTRLISNVNGSEQTTGRGNFAFHTINLPRLAIETYLQTKDPEEKKKVFFEKLDSILEDVKGSLLDRFALISNKTYENYPFTMQQGLYLTSDDKPHKITDKVGEVLKQASLSIGYVGLAETMMLLTGKTYGIDHDIDDYALSIVKHIREFTDKCQKETHLNWSCFATPAEAVAGRFANIDKNIFQNEKKLDVDKERLFGKGYYTNSHMMDYSLETTLDNKIATEAPFHKLTNAGHIFYYKLNGDLSKNLDAVKACIDEMFDGDLGYFTVTFDSDTCLHCMHHGVIDNECPVCGNKDENDIVRVRRITGYLTGAPRKSITQSWNDGKLNELRDRHNI